MLKLSKVRAFKGWMLIYQAFLHLNHNNIALIFFPKLPLWPFERCVYLPTPTTCCNTLKTHWLQRTTTTMSLVIDLLVFISFSDGTPVKSVSENKIQQVADKNLDERLYEQSRRLPLFLSILNNVTFFSLSKRKACSVPFQIYEYFLRHLISSSDALIVGSTRDGSQHIIFPITLNYWNYTHDFKFYLISNHLQATSPSHDLF